MSRLADVSIFHCESEDIADLVLGDGVFAAGSYTPSVSAVAFNDQGPDDVRP